MNQQLLPIGRFAQLCRLSIRQLRHYDELGLLRPAQVDPASGYRYYDREQARSALAIALLRTLEVPLPAITEILTGDAVTVTRVLRAEQDRLQGELARRRVTLGTLQRLLEEGLGRHQVTLMREPARRLLVARASCAPEDIGVATRACLVRVLAAADTSGLGWTPPLLGLFPLDLEPPVAIAAGIQARGDAPGLEAEHLPAAAMAVTTHLGPYADLPLAYHSLFAWIYEQGHRPRGPAARPTSPILPPPTRPSWSPGCRCPSRTRRRAHDRPDHKVDFKQVYRQLYTAHGDPIMVDVPELPYLMADGAGDPGAAQYRATVQALYGIAYAIRFALKNDVAMEYPVMPLQGRWWAAGEREVNAVDRSLWVWTMMILQPPQATEALVARATARVRRTKPAAAVDGVHLARLAEGRCAQVLHIGPYREETPTIERLRAFVQAQGCVVAGRHHEIYLSDPSRTAPEKLKTIIRYPVATT